MRQPSKSVCERVHAEDMARRSATFTVSKLLEAIAANGPGWRAQRRIIQGTHWLDSFDPDGLCFGRTAILPDEAPDVPVATTDQGGQQ